MGDGRQRLPYHRPENVQLDGVHHDHEGGVRMRKNGRLKRNVHLISVKAEKALKEAVTDTIRDHARTGDPVVIWRHGKVVWVPAKQLLQQQRKK